MLTTALGSPTHAARAACDAAPGQDELPHVLAAKRCTYCSGCFGLSTKARFVSRGCSFYIKKNALREHKGF